MGNEGSKERDRISLQALSNSQHVVGSHQQATENSVRVVKNSNLCSKKSFKDDGGEVQDFHTLATPPEIFFACHSPLTTPFPLPIFLPSILPFLNLLTPILVRCCSSPLANP